MAGLPTVEQSARPGERSVDSVVATRRELLPVTMTADGNLKGTPGYLGNLVLTNGSGAAATYTLVNAASGSTPVVATFTVANGTSLPVQLDWYFDTAIRLIATSWTSSTACGGVA